MLARTALLLLLMLLLLLVVVIRLSASGCTPNEGTTTAQIHAVISQQNGTYSYDYEYIKKIFVEFTYADETFISSTDWRIENCKYAPCTTKQHALYEVLPRRITDL